MNFPPRLRKVALALATLPLVLGLTSCTAVCMDCEGGMPESQTRFSYTNRSKEIVRMAIETSAGDTLPIPIALGTFETFDFFDTRFNFGPAQKAHIRFGTTNQTCLTFEGAIRDTLADPRSLSAYTQIGVAYTYTFTDSLLHRSGSCP